MAYFKGIPNGDLCIYCNKIYFHGEWRNVDEIDHDIMPLEINSTICPNCSYERFPKFYIGNNIPKGRKTKRNGTKFYSLLKWQGQRD